MARTVPPGLCALPRPTRPSKRAASAALPSDPASAASSADAFELGDRPRAGRTAFPLSPARHRRCVDGVDAVGGARGRSPRPQHAPRQIGEQDLVAGRACRRASRTRRCAARECSPATDTAASARHRRDPQRPSPAPRSAPVARLLPQETRAEVPRRAPADPPCAPAAPAIGSTRSRVARIGRRRARPAANSATQARLLASRMRKSTSLPSVLADPAHDPVLEHAQQLHLGGIGVSSTSSRNTVPPSAAMSCPS